MNLYEYQAKRIFNEYGLPIPNGVVCSTLDALKESIKKINSPWIGKCQIQSGGRGKSGGVKVLNSEKEVKSFIKYWLGRRLVTYQTDNIGEKVYNILLEERVSIIQELYLSIVIDRNNSKIICLVSNHGGTEIEHTVKNISRITHKIFLDPLMGPQIYQGRKLGFILGLNFIQVEQFTNIFMSLGKMFLKHNLVLAEINPLVVTNNNSLLCLDAKIKIDRNALFRQKKILLIKKILQENKYLLSNNDDIILNTKLNYIPMEGNIGCIVNGAGLAMATMDLLSLYGGKAANFLDIGGDVTKESFIECIETIINNKKVQVILINIFGGIVCCDLISEGIIMALSIFKITLPVVVRLEGNNSTLGNKKLMNSTHNIIADNNLCNAIQKSILIVNRLNNVNIN